MIDPTLRLKPEYEIVESNQMAESMISLQSVIERNAIELAKVKKELRAKRESLKSVLDNDMLLADAQQVAKERGAELKQHKARVLADPQATSLKATITELKEQKNDIEETLSNHLVSYYQMSGSSSFDTSTGDQAEFKIKANLKPKQLKLFGGV